MGKTTGLQQGIVGKTNQAVGENIGDQDLHDDGKAQAARGRDEQDPPPLRWLMRKAESHGLAFRTEVELEGDSVTAPTTDSYGKFGYGIYQWISSPLYRPIGADPVERDDGTHPTVNETSSNDGERILLIAPSI